MPEKETFQKTGKKAWVVAVSMGYGHQRAAFPLKSLAFEGKVLKANNYEGIPQKEKRFWAKSQSFYEFISRTRRVPLFGRLAFFIFDQFQKIPKYYPKRDLSRPTFVLKQVFSLIKKGWGKHLIEKLKESPLPLINTFYVTAFMAEYFNYPGQIYCLICDADIGRFWAPWDSSKSKIKYFVPTSWAENRLKLYGVKEENISLTGFPLPLENIGNESMEVLKKDLRYRLLNLDPKEAFLQQYGELVEKHLGLPPQDRNHVLTLMFAVGGAGAQKELGIKIVKSLLAKIKAKEIKVILVAGIREEVSDYFIKHITALQLRESLNENLEIIFSENMEDYFEKFNQALRVTDILWTKPSELSFYSGLGLPIIIAPPLGSQEKFNEKWLLSLGAGVSQENPKHADHWLFDFLDSGRLAEAAFQGFIEAEKLGTFKIKKIIFKD